jgi:hypothetical protein
MDNLFDRAHDIIDKAQGAVATVTAQAAWTANQGLVIRNIEGRVNALQAEGARVTSEIGERVYAAWKARIDDPRIPALCGHLDGLREQHDRAVADLTAARAAVFDPHSYQPSAASYQQTSTAAPPPRLMPPRPILSITPARQPPAPVKGAFSSPVPPSPQATSTSWQVMPDQSRPAAAAAPAAPAPTPSARECPNCGHFVPGGVDFCPSCGIRVI